MEFRHKQLQTLILESAMWILEYFINYLNFCCQALFYHLLLHTSIAL